MAAQGPSGGPETSTSPTPKGCTALESSIQSIQAPHTVVCQLLLANQPGVAHATSPPDSGEAHVWTALLAMMRALLHCSMGRSAPWPNARQYRGHAAALTFGSSFAAGEVGIQLTARGRQHAVNRAWFTGNLRRALAAPSCRRHFRLQQLPQRTAPWAGRGKNLSAFWTPRLTYRPGLLRHPLLHMGKLREHRRKS
jgi:hypothetical protein